MFLLKGFIYRAISFTDQWKWVSLLRNLIFCVVSCTDQWALFSLLKGFGLLCCFLYISMNIVLAVKEFDLLCCFLYRSMDFVLAVERIWSTKKKSTMQFYKWVKENSSHSWKDLMYCFVFPCTGLWKVYEKI